ncbi:MAG TPA: hypothetical protein ENI27_00420 [bacterium]|nr:hypothetical protein [bacterium]
MIANLNGMRWINSLTPTARPPKPEMVLVDRDLFVANLEFSTGIYAALNEHLNRKPSEATMQLFAEAEEALKR